MLFLVCIIIAIIIGNIIDIRSFGFENIFIQSALSFAYALIGVLFGVIVCMIAIAIPGPTEIVETQAQSLYALKDSIAVEGDFFLGTGSVNNKLQYYYVIETETGTYQIKNIDIDDVTLYYIEDGSDCRIEHNIKIYSNPIHNFLSLSATQDEYKIYIPKNSICQEFTIDLE